MANVYLNLPAPAADGAGASVDVSSMGALKTVTVADNGAVIPPSVTIEFACDAAGTIWTPLKTFTLPGQQSFYVAALWMRAVVSNYKGGGAPNVDVAGQDDGTSGANLPTTAGDGTGAPIDVSALGNFKTVQVGSTFRGGVSIEISGDGVDYQTVWSTTTPGSYTEPFAARFMRVVRTGVPLNTPGLPVITVNGTDIGGGGGGSSNAQRFQYTVTGLEPDPSELTIPLPVARADALYLVFPSQEEATNQLTMNVATASKAVGQFVLSLSAVATAGDVFSFIVDDPT